jgi:3-oxoacyl-[acyl-carrier-protein] synthase-1
VPRWAAAGKQALLATSFGETGAAASALGACMAVRAFARGYAGGNEVLVWSSSPCGAKSAFVVSKEA